MCCLFLFLSFPMWHPTRTTSPSTTTTKNLPWNDNMVLKGVRFDPDIPQTIRLEFAKSNTKVSKPKQQNSSPPAAAPHPTLLHPLTGREYSFTLISSYFIFCIWWFDVFLTTTTSRHQHSCVTLGFSLYFSMIFFLASMFGIVEGGAYPLRYWNFHTAMSAGAYYSSRE